MPMTREGQGADTFLLTCADCDQQLRIHEAGTGFEAARIAATRRGWTFVRLERCGRCTKAATAKPTARRSSSRSRKA